MRPSLRARSVVVATVTLTLLGGAAACGDDAEGTGGTGGGSTATSTGATTTGGGGDTATGGGAPALPGPDELEVGVWNELVPGGDTVCARGTPYSFWVRPGTSNKVIVDFIGGGACWDELTCGLAGQIFSDSIDDIRGYIEDDVFGGIYDHDNAENPVADYWHVVVPYCTGDIHWGDATVTYGAGTDDEVTIEHKGAVNARRVLDWVYDGFEAPEKVFVTGCSAGSYGSALWSAHVMQHYGDVPVIQFGDSGAGVVTANFFQESFPSWNAQQAFPAFIPELDPAQNDLLEKALPDLYIGIANHFGATSENMRMSQYNTLFDENQHFYFAAMGGGDIDEWSTQMQASIAEIELATEDGTRTNRYGIFDSYLAQGEQHCIIPYDNFYDVKVGDGETAVRLVDWLADMLEGNVESVACEGAECDEPTPGSE